MSVHTYMCTCVQTNEYKVSVSCVLCAGISICVQSLAQISGLVLFSSCLQVHPPILDAGIRCTWTPSSHPSPSHCALLREAGATAL